MVDQLGSELEGSVEIPVFPTGTEQRTREEVKMEQLDNPTIRYGKPASNPVTEESQSTWRKIVFAKWLGYGFVLLLSLPLFWGITTLLLPEYGNIAFFGAGIIMWVLSRIKVLGPTIGSLMYPGLWSAFLGALGMGAAWTSSPIEAALVLLALGVIVLTLIAAFAFAGSAYIVPEYERWGIFRMGKWIKHLGPGRIQLLPFGIESVFGILEVKRERTVHVPVNQGVMQPSASEDGLVPVKLNTTIRYYVLDDPVSIRRAFLNVDNLDSSMIDMAETSTVEWMLANKLNALYGERLKDPDIEEYGTPVRSLHIQSIMNRKVKTWGVIVVPVGISDVVLPTTLANEFAQAEAASVRRDSAEIMAQAEMKIWDEILKAIENRFSNLEEKDKLDLATEIRRMQAFGGPGGSRAHQIIDVGDLAGVRRRESSTASS